MQHRQLIRIGQYLGYQIPFAGLCKGFSGMWSQAVCAGDLASFNQRLNLLETYADSPEQLIRDIDQARQLVKDGKQLTDLDQKLLEIPAFFEGITLYLQPDIGYDMFGEKWLFQSNEVEISQYVQSDKLEQQGGLKRAFNTNDQYDITRLTYYLKTIDRELKNTSNVAINFGANGHSIAVRVVGPDRFELIDTNQLHKMGRHFTSEQLAKELNYAFSNSSWLDWFRDPDPLMMQTSIFTTANNPLNLEKLTARSKITTLTRDSKNSTLLHAAASTNDVNTLERMDFNLIDVNQGASSINSSPLAFAVMSNSQDAAKYLLKVERIDVHKPENEFPAAFTAIAFRHYDLAYEIIKHPTFDLHKMYPLGTVLHCIAETKRTTPETMALAQHLINMGAKVDEKNAAGQTPLFNACKGGSLELVQFFLNNGAKINSLDNEHRSVLHQAAMSGNADIVKLLLTQGLSCNQVDSNNITPFHGACISGNKAIVEELLANGGDCNLRTKQGLTPLDLACQNKKPQLISTLLPHTTLSRKDIEPNSPLSQLVAQCDSNVQRDFLKKALETYVTERMQQPEYLDLFNWGVQKDTKIAAATALLSNLNGANVDLQPHQEALDDGILSSLFQLYNKTSPKENTKAQGTYQTILTQLDATNPVPETSNERCQAPQSLKEQENTENTIELEAEEQSVDQQFSSPLPTPIKTTPF